MCDCVDCHKRGREVGDCSFIRCGMVLVCSCTCVGQAGVYDNATASGGYVRPRHTCTTAPWPRCTCTVQGINNAHTMPPVATFGNARTTHSLPLPYRAHELLDVHTHAGIWTFSLSLRQVRLRLQQYLSISACASKRLLVVHTLYRTRLRTVPINAVGHAWCCPATLPFINAQPCINPVAINGR